MQMLNDTRPPHKHCAKKGTHVNVLPALHGVIRRQRRVIVVAAHAKRAQLLRFFYHLHSSRLLTILCAT